MKKKFLWIFILQIILIFGIMNCCSAAWISVDKYKPEPLKNASKIFNIGNDIIGIIQFVGSFASVIVLIVIGIKYMLGSAEEKAEYKKTLLPYVIGCILIFGISNILAIIENIAGQIAR